MPAASFPEAGLSQPPRNPLAGFSSNKLLSRPALPLAGTLPGASRQRLQQIAEAQQQHASSRLAFSHQHHRPAPSRQLNFADPIVQSHSQPEPASFEQSQQQLILSQPSEMQFTTHQVAGLPADMMPRPKSGARPPGSCSKQMAYGNCHEALGNVQDQAQRRSGAIIKALVQEMYSALASEGDKQAGMILDQVKILAPQLHDLANGLKTQQQQMDATSSKLDSLSASLEMVTSMLTNLPEATALATMKLQTKNDTQHKACLRPNEGSPQVQTRTAEGCRECAERADPQHQPARSRQQVIHIPPLPQGPAGHGHMTDMKMDQPCLKTSHVNANAKHHVQPIVQQKASGRRPAGQHAAKEHPCRSDAVSHATRERVSSQVQQPKLTSKRPGHIPRKGPFKLDNSQSAARQPDVPLRLEPSALTHENRKMTARSLAAQSHEPGSEIMPALFGMFESTRMQQPGFSREAMFQIDDDEIQKEVQQKLMRHRRKRMRRMQDQQG
ncbi:hypothetical protein WJX74_000924 [Apatococcus lobatus]|uniref:Protein PAIR1 n=1 Tax=Apatococcus lobatus TaxID=904363 RepID=A0AAW1S275_9CHLO